MKPSETEIEIEIPTEILRKLEHCAETENCSVEEYIKRAVAENLEKLENSMSL